MASFDADIICLQETKLTEERLKSYEDERIRKPNRCSIKFIPGYDA